MIEKTSQEKANQTVNIAGRGAANLITMMIGRLATLIIVTLAGIVIPRVLGAEVYGQYAAVTAVLIILQTVASGGLQQVEVRYLAPLWHRQNRATAVALGSSIWTLRLAFSVVVGLGAILWLGPSSQFPQQVSMSLLLGFLCFLRTAQGATQSQFLPIGHVSKLMGFEFVRVSLQLFAVAGCDEVREIFQTMQRSRRELAGPISEIPLS